MREKDKESSRKLHVETGRVKKTNEALFPAYQSLCTSEIPTTLKALKLKPEVRQDMILNPKEKARDDALYPFFRVCKEKVPL